MKIKCGATAGTLESSDIMVTIRPETEGLRIQLTSSVENYYGESIRQTIRQTLEELGVEQATVEAVDHGALDCTIRARVTTAVRRAEGREDT